ncbi:MAG: hypothetical protein ABIP97_05895 [Chthoniobacterales bacterium]
MNWITKFCNGSIRAEDLEQALLRIEAAWLPEYASLQRLVEEFPLGAAVLGKLLSNSPVSVEKICNTPQALQWLADPAVCASSRSRRRMELDWNVMQNEGGERLSSLRRFKSWELLRIALREVAGISDILETGVELASIAEICVEEVYAAVLTEYSGRWGNPGDDLVILGMGKLGGQELNYSSDIDLISFYGEDGEVKPGFTRQEFFNRVVERMLALFSMQDKAGVLFKVDLRLRPEGMAGPLTRSVPSMENYYAGFGETWERMALIKSRRISGSKEMAYDFERIMQSFIYPKSISHDVVDEVAAIKSRIERDILGPDELHRNVKLGCGGIREIEFTVQTLQLLHGARQPFLQERNTLKALNGLAQLAFLPSDDALALRKAYIFLRQVEHRLQISNEEQTHTIPTNPEELYHLALNLEFPDTSLFLSTLQSTMHTVRSIFERVLTENNRENLPRQNLENSMDFFADSVSAERMLKNLGSPDRSKHVSPRTRQLYERLQPLLLGQLKNTAEPDSALAGFVDFVDAYGIRGILFETLAANPRLLELLIKLFDASYFLTRAIVRRPQWIEEIARGQELGLAMTAEDHQAAMLSFQTQYKDEPLNHIRIYRQFQVLRIGLRDILGFCDLQELQKEYTALAEACVIQVLADLKLENQITLVAMGKFGGRELCYGSDLDIVAIGTDQAGVARLIKEIGKRNEEGLIFPIDLRLRPEGNASPLATPLEMYKKYYEGRAQLWEIQALSKARVISGPLRAEVEKIIDEAFKSAGTRSDLFPQIAAMHAKVVENRGGANDALFFKTGRGGLMAAEFIVQSLEMQHGLREPNTIYALNSLKENEALPSADAELLKENYLFLRHIEICLRRIEDASVSQIPAEEKRQSELARRMGFEALPEFLKKYAQVRADIKTAFDKIVVSA